MSESDVAPYVWHGEHGRCIESTLGLLDIELCVMGGHAVQL